MSVYAQGRQREGKFSALQATHFRRQWHCDVIGGDKMVSLPEDKRSCFLELLPISHPAFSLSRCTVDRRGCTGTKVLSVDLCILPTTGLPFLDDIMAASSISQNLRIVMNKTYTVRRILIYSRYAPWAFLAVLRQAPTSLVMQYHNAISYCVVVKSGKGYFTLEKTTSAAARSLGYSLVRHRGRRKPL